MSKVRCLGACALLAAAACRSSPPSAVDPADLGTFVDTFMAEAMAREKIPGAAFVFVQDGRVVLQRGYGIADIAAGRAVDPDATVWRVGSISKVFTATAVMQLVDRGLVDLDTPIDAYVRRVVVPTNYPEPVTVRQLLDHTAGFDEIRPGTQAEAKEWLLPLDRFLEGKLKRIRSPGGTIAYSTYGITLAGEMVEELSGSPFETYLQRNIWEPLGMRHASIEPPADGTHLAKGYELEGDAIREQPWEWYHTTPASSVNATVADMARFLEAHLGLGAYGKARILSERSALEMQKQQVTMHPSMPGYALGWYEDLVGDLRILEHGGNMAGFSSLMVLVPSAKAGFFVVHHRENARLRDDLKWALLERLYPAARQRRPVPTTLPKADEVRAERFAGRYAPLSSCWTCEPVQASSLMNVRANDDGTLSFAGGRWIQVDPFRFVNERGSGYVVFRPDESGEIRDLFAGGFWGWRKI